MIALDALVDQAPNLLAAILGSRTEAAQESHGGQAKWPTILIEKGHLGTSDRLLASARVGSHQLGQRIKAFPARLRLWTVQRIDDVAQIRRAYFRLLLHHDGHHSSCLLTRQPRRPFQRLHQRLTLFLVAERLVSLLAYILGSRAQCSNSSTEMVERSIIPEST